MGGSRQAAHRFGPRYSGSLPAAADFVIVVIVIIARHMLKLRGTVG